MLNTALEILRKIDSNGHKAYVVGGFVRDKYLNIESLDVDICTSATPKELINIFPNANIKNEKYGSITIFHKNIRFELTTFRRELKYKDARKPIEIEYINSLDEDLERRDFIMNTLCMDKDNNIIDKYNAKKDIDKKIIRTVGNPDKKFKEDALRMLRAIRFVSQLDFKLGKETKQAISNNKKLISLLTNNRKKQELEKTFLGKNSKEAIELMVNLDLQKYFEIKGLENITIVNDPCAMWAQLNLDIQKWPFTKNEKDTINKVIELLKLETIDDYILYKYGLYICEKVYQIKKKDYKLLSKIHKELPIKNKKDINITILEISEILNETPSEFIKDILTDIEKQIINKKLTNSKEKITKYIIKNYKKAHLK